MSILITNFRADTCVSALFNLSGTVSSFDIFNKAVLIIIIYENKALVNLLIKENHTAKSVKDGEIA